MYHYVSGYTARLAGTERGVTEPQATFSTCFGAPFLPLPASKYAELLGKYVDMSGANVYLVNTGWSGGPAGNGGSRMQEMVEICVKPMVQENPEMTEDAARAMMQQFLPTLKRWRTA